MTTPPAQFALAAVTAAVFTVASYVTFGLPNRARLAALLALAIPIGGAPALIDVDRPLVRFLAGVVSVICLVKLWDMHVSIARGERPTFGEFLRWLPHIFFMVYRKRDEEPRPERHENLARLLHGAAGTAAGLSLLVLVFRVNWSGSGFFLEHVAKVLPLYVLLPGLANVLTSIWRLLGGRARDYLDNPLVSRTPAEFWRRYNRVTQQFFYEDVFKPAGGRRAPLRAALTTFLISALLHEILFSIAIGRVQGYQTAFFLLHGVAVAATWRMRPRGWAAVGGVMLTLAFNLLSAPLFFASVDSVLPFYSQPLPEWLDW